ncbi:MAG: hypothetical protein AAFU49_12920 [Pseudomonadota bacterium]
MDDAAAIGLAVVVQPMQPVRCKRHEIRQGHRPVGKRLPAMIAGPGVRGQIEPLAQQPAQIVPLSFWKIERNGCAGTVNYRITVKLTESFKQHDGKIA